MTENITTPTAAGGLTAEKPRRKKRVFLWFFLAVQALFIVWIIAGMGGADIPDCTGLTGAKLDDCELEAAASGVGTGIGVFLVVVMWMITDFFLALGYGIYRLAKRP